ncbi:MAG: glycogen debranching protein GlgX [Actinobacteria bacterium]|nr:glycogen debranching protein GlgX [Actinomycetota bacterium]
MTPRISRGKPHPRGVTVVPEGINVAVFSKHAEAIEFCLFDPQGTQSCVTLPAKTGFVHHGFVPGISPGQRYGLRAHGPFDPSAGHRFDASKLLLDPYAKAIEGQIRWGPSNFSVSAKGVSAPHSLSGEGGEGHVLNGLDSQAAMPRCVVVTDDFDWEGDSPPDVPLNESLIYEAHVKGLTKMHPQIDTKIRGTYAALASAPMLEHLKSLNVTAVDLLPVHQHLHDHFLVKRGLRNHWGYQTIGYFAPHNEYAMNRDPQGSIDEFKSMVKRLHRAGIEVWLDVVYNHTAEGNDAGPTVFLKGLDNSTYYRLHDDRSRYVNHTGVGNTLDLRQPDVLMLVMDSLRYWVTEMHVDGFRFDLALTLGRESDEFSQGAAFFDAVHQDPILSTVKLVGEPWDLGPGGYQIGNLPTRWSEWNGRYRDTVRDFWNGRSKSIGEFASRLAGSPDLYEPTGRDTSASINFVTAHDGFTLADLVTYNSKHNEANGHNNTDGESNNKSWNCGIEGPTDDPVITELRAKQMRNFLFTLFVSQGVPMLVAGDEMARSQSGNNNAYCQDNEISWLDWSLIEKQHDLLAFAKKLSSLRSTQPVLRRRNFFRSAHSPGPPQIAWFTPDGHEMNTADWSWEYATSISVWLNGEAIEDITSSGEPVVGDTLWLAFNAFGSALTFTLPERRWGTSWESVLCTDPKTSTGGRLAAAGKVELSAHSAFMAWRVE